MQLSEVLAHNALVVTRNIEWGSVVLGYEQANKYEVKNELGDTVALLAEDANTVGSWIGRQMLRTRRSFSATVLNASGSQVLFKLRRPAYLISSSMYIESADGEPIGEVQRQWHPLYRKYALFVDRQQVAQITGGFLTWEFALQDMAGGTLALIDRNFSGFAREIFTDAGKYVIHFGQEPAAAAEEAYRVQVAAATMKKKAVPETLPAPVATDSNVIVSSTGSQLVVARPLELEGRMVALAAAISVDYDFFSQHSSGGGLMGPGLMMPVPIPGMGGYGDAGGAGGGEAGVPPADEGAFGAQQAEQNDSEQSWMDQEEDTLGGGEDGGGFWDALRGLGEVAGVLPSDD